MPRSITLLYFAWVRERLGRDQETLPIHQDNQTIADILTDLSARGGVYADIFSDVDKLRFALDADFGTTESPVGTASELAIFPPVTGG